MQCCSKLACSVCTRHPGQFDNSIPTSLSPGYRLFHQFILGAGAGGIFQLHCILERWKGPHNNMINNIFMWISFSTIQLSEAFSVSDSYILRHSHVTLRFEIDKMNDNSDNKALYSLGEEGK